ncbi:hypothetical protein J7L87_04985 [bacterium]|nr:hypothetical protein [bacterium]
MIMWKRKLYRIGIGLIFPLTYIFTKTVFLPLLITTFFLTLLGALEYERWKNPNVWKWLLERAGGVFKTHPGKLTGDTCFILSVLLLLLFFPKEIAIASLFFLIFGDAGSGIIGSKFGKITVFPGKTIEGFIGGFIFNLIVSFFLLTFLNLQFYILLSGVLISSIFEILPLKIDDNLTVGLSSGILMWILKLTG